jgi:hypothetical protein
VVVVATSSGRLSAWPLPNRGNNRLSGEFIGKRIDANFIPIIFSHQHILLYLCAVVKDIKCVFFRQAACFGDYLEVIGKVDLFDRLTS